MKNDPMENVYCTEVIHKKRLLRKTSMSKEESKAFHVLLRQKLLEAAKNPAFIFKAIERMIFSEGLVYLNPPRFQPYTPEGKVEYEQHMPKKSHDEEWLAKYWCDHPERSIADALRYYYRVKSPKLEVGLIPFHINIPSMASLVEQKKDLGIKSWSLHWLMRGPSHMLETFEHAIALDAIAFAKTCGATVGEMKKLDIKKDVRGLENIQAVMFAALKKHQRSLKGKELRRITEAIHEVEACLEHGYKSVRQRIKMLFGESIILDDSFEDSAGYILALAQEWDSTGKLKTINPKAIFTHNETWIQFMEKWPSTDPDDPHSLNILLQKMYKLDVDITLKLIQGNCNGEVVTGSQEKLAWKDFLKTALLFAKERRNDLNWSPEIRETIRILEKTLGITAVSKDADLRKSPSPKSSGPIPERWAGEKAAYKEFLKGRTRDIGFASIYDAFRRQSQLTQNLSVKDEQRLREVLRKIHQSAWLDIH